MNLKLILTFVTSITSVCLFAQSKEQLDQKLDIHDHHKNEIGIANSPVYFIKEKVYAYGLHVHYIRNVPKSNFGIGLGFERNFDAHKHNTIGLVTIYRPIDM